MRARANNPLNLCVPAECFHNQVAGWKVAELLVTAVAAVPPVVTNQRVGHALHAVVAREGGRKWLERNSTDRVQWLRPGPASLSPRASVHLEVMRPPATRSRVTREKTVGDVTTRAFNSLEFETCCDLFRVDFIHIWHVKLWKDIRCLSSLTCPSQIAQNASSDGISARVKIEPILLDVSTKGPLWILKNIISDRA